MAVGSIIRYQSKRFSLGPIFFALAVFITVVSIYMPFSPWMPASGLDPSWIRSLNQAFAQNLSFGTDIIYTYGPYAALWTNQYHPAVDTLILYASFYFVICFFLCFMLVFNTRKWVFSILLLWVLMLGSKDIAFFFYPLMVALLSFKLLYLSEIKVKNKILIFYVGIIFSAFGLIFLIKATFFLICVPITLLSAVLFFLNRKKILAFTVIFSPLVSVFILWSLSGQTSSLFDYFTATLYIISGYSEAMSLPGPRWDIIIFVISVIFLLFCLLTEKSLPLKARYFLGFCFSLFLFLSFKEGFVRHDAHALVAGYSLLVTVLCVSLIISIKRLWTIISLFIAVLSGCFIIHHYESINPKHIILKVGNNYLSAWSGFNLRIHEPNALKTQFERALLNLKQQAQLPVWSGTTDIYSYNQALLIASGNTWAPRPVFQSFQAYTKKLAEINKNYLLSSNAPDHIVFKVETIDDRLPSLDDGASWPVLLAKYKPDRGKNDYLYLQRKKYCHFTDTMAQVSSKTEKMNTWVDLPGSTSLIYAKINLHLSILGKIKGLLYKPPQLVIEIKLNDNSEKKYRFIAQMSQSGFIISPLVENTADFAKLYKNPIKTPKRVKRIKLSIKKNQAMFWDQNYQITFSEFTPTQLVQCLEEKRDEAQL